MAASDVTSIVLFLLCTIVCAPVLGLYMAHVFEGNRSFLHPLLYPLEKASYKIGGINPDKEMHWKDYLKSLLAFNALGFIFLFLIQVAQHWLPFNPQKLSTVPWPLAFNVAASFTTNTNWQSYAGETTMSYASQMLGLTVQNFLSAATGNAALLALIRGLSRKASLTIGNFWVDLVRAVIYLFLPLAILFSLVLVSQGVIQNLSSYIQVETLEDRLQVIPMGPVASQEAIKQLGSNGGGFFNVNSAHPFENPTPISNFLELFAIILIPAASVFMYGRMLHAQKHSWILFASMSFIWICAFTVSLYFEYGPNPVLEAYPILEGKETRIGITNSILWSVTTTATSNGSVNNMLSSLSPLAGGAAMLNILLGEVAFGGVGVGMCALVMFIMLTVFLSGLMVGRTPEYLGKKVEKREIRWAMIAVLLGSAITLVGSGFSSVFPAALSRLGNNGPHGLSELLYAFGSAAGNNGSAFAGLDANTPYFNILLGIIMVIARLAILVPSIVVAGLMASQKITPPSVGTFSVDTCLFAILLLNVIFLVGALSFLPALALGPIIEHLLMMEGRSF